MKVSYIGAVVLLLAAVAVRPAWAQPGAPKGAATDDKDIVKAAEFAVKAQQEAMKKDNPKAEDLKLVKVVRAKKQVVAGMNYILTLRVKLGDKTRTAEAKVWEKAWLKEIKLTSWKFIEDKDSKDESKPNDGTPSAPVHEQK